MCSLSNHLLEVHMSLEPSGVAFRNLACLMGFLFLLGSTTFPQGRFQGLGDLPGGTHSSQARGLSRDGSVVVGRSNSANGFEAFGWSAIVGMVGLGGSSLLSEAWQASGTGDTIVGWSALAEGGRAFRWTASSGMVDLPGLPGNDGGAAYGVSGNGRVIVGLNHFPSQRNALDSDLSGGSSIAVRWVGDSVASLGRPAEMSSNLATGVSFDGSVIVGYGFGPSLPGEAFRWSNDVMMLLGDLPGGNFYSQAFGISGDGSVVVGYSVSGSGNEAFRWTSGTGMIGLGDLPGGQFESRALAASGDGSIIVGSGSSTVGQEAFIWRPDSGMRSLKVVLQTRYGIDLTGWTLLEATGISSNGLVIVGTGINPGGLQEAWQAVLTPIVITRPIRDQLLISGTMDTLMWSAPGINAVTIEFSPDDGQTYSLIDNNVPGDSGRYIWLVPEALSTRCRIRLTEVNNGSINSTSPRFKAKGYRLTRLAADSTFEAFTPVLDGWQFGNATVHMWPASWWSQFDYLNGVDPHTNQVYPIGFRFPPITARPDDFTDWPLFADAFGTDQCFLNVISGTYRPSAIAKWAGEKMGFNGACSGFSISSLLAFDRKARFVTRFPGIGNFGRLADLPLDDERRKIVNQLFEHFAGQQHFGFALQQNNRTPRETLAELKEMFRGDSADSRYLYIAQDSGAHAVVPYRLWRSDILPGKALVDVYDSNFPLDEAPYVEIDSLNDSWSYPFLGNSWQGTNRLFLMDPASTYLQPPQLTPTLFASGIANEHTTVGGIEIYNSSTASISISDIAGQTIGFRDGRVFGSMTGAMPIMPMTSRPHPPIGYVVPPNAYKVAMSHFTDSLLTFTTFETGRMYRYWRVDAQTGQADNIGFSGGLKVGNHDLQTKISNLETIIIESNRERVFEVMGFALASTDSVECRTPDNDRLTFVNRGPQKTYTLRIRLASTTEHIPFLSLPIALPSNAAHVIAPAWHDLRNEPVRIYVDLDNNGTIDDSLLVGNTVGVGNADFLFQPGTFGLAQNFPNPFNPATVIKFQIPHSSHVVLKVYDIIGREVQTLVNENLPLGSYEKTFDANGLAGGVYLYRMVAGDFVHTRKLLLLR